MSETKTGTRKELVIGCHEILEAVRKKILWHLIDQRAKGNFSSAYLDDFLAEWLSRTLYQFNLLDKKCEESVKLFADSAEIILKIKNEKDRAIVSTGIYNLYASQLTSLVTESIYMGFFMMLLTDETRENTQKIMQDIFKVAQETGEKVGLSDMLKS